MSTSPTPSNLIHAEPPPARVDSSPQPGLHPSACPRPLSPEPDPPNGAATRCPLHANVADTRLPSIRVPKDDPTPTTICRAARVDRLRRRALMTSPSSTGLRRDLRPQVASYATLVCPADPSSAISGVSPFLNGESLTSASRAAMAGAVKLRGGVTVVGQHHAFYTPGDGATAPLASTGSGSSYAVWIITYCLLDVATMFPLLSPYTNGALLNGGEACDDPPHSMHDESLKKQNRPHVLPSRHEDELGHVPQGRERLTSHTRTRSLASLGRAVGVAWHGEARRGEMCRAVPSLSLLVMAIEDVVMGRADSDLRHYSSSFLCCNSASPSPALRAHHRREQVSPTPLPLRDPDRDTGAIRFLGSVFTRLLAQNRCVFTGVRFTVLDTPPPSNDYTAPRLLPVRLRRTDCTASHLGVHFDV
ncbi:hypothetical protein HU200_055643 [Digitaria exilis]|uniref:Uncharacterized protein n=1 Tax=Digitaria exilis TaxID=1010633 RepID=A0A835ASP4_9POAL|nr:hypothetical protein HU200_055643 [Digitaria exilis]